MRKCLIASIPQRSQVAAENQNWFDLESIDVVEITAEETEFPIESALLPGEPRGWRAAVSGDQTIRLRFDQPQRLTRIRLSFEETQARDRKSLSCYSLWTHPVRRATLFANNEISTPPPRNMRLRTILSNSPTSGFWNWTSCLTRAGAPRSRHGGGLCCSERCFASGTPFPT